MRVIDKGHHYELDVFDGDATGYRSLLRFMKRVIAAALRELRANPPRKAVMSELQPIGSEPKDGKPFLGYLGGLNVPYFVCWWSTKIKDGQPYICILGIGELWDHKLFPTHWAPLPARPVGSPPVTK